MPDPRRYSESSANNFFFYFFFFRNLELPLFSRIPYLIPKLYNWYLFSTFASKTFFFAFTKLFISGMFLLILLKSLCWKWQMSRCYETWNLTYCLADVQILFPHRICFVTFFLVIQNVWESENENAEIS